MFVAALQRKPTVSFLLLAADRTAVKNKKKKVLEQLVRFTLLHKPAPLRHKAVIWRRHFFFFPCSWQKRQAFVVVAFDDRTANNKERECKFMALMWLREHANGSDFFMTLSSEKISGDSSSVLLCFEELSDTSSLMKQNVSRTGSNNKNSTGSALLTVTTTTASPETSPWSRNFRSESWKNLNSPTFQVPPPPHINTNSCASHRLLTTWS